MKINPLKLVLAAAALLFPALAGAQKPSPVAPENMTEYERNVGKSYRFTLTGKTTGSLWGTDVYTTDSNLSTAAVHAGVVKAGETADVEVTIVPGQGSYAGSRRNGVSSADWPAYGASYKFVKGGGGDMAATKPSEPSGKPADSSAGAGKKEAPRNLSAYDKQVGKRFTFTVIGEGFGMVFGSGPYTTDSTLAAAAVHAGLVKVDAEGTVEVEILPETTGDFTGSERNGVKTFRWPIARAAFKFVEKK